MTKDWNLRQKQLLWHYYQVKRMLGAQCNFTSRERIYELAGRKIGYESPWSVGKLIRAMERDSNIIRYIETISSYDEIE